MVGSWTDFDANYPAGKLTPGAAFVVAVGHLEGLRSVYAGGTGEHLAEPFRRYSLGYERDMLARAERYLAEVPFEQFLDEARSLLRPQQALCLALNLLDAAIADAVVRPEYGERLTVLIEGLGIHGETLEPYRQMLLLKNNLGQFPQ